MKKNKKSQENKCNKKFIIVLISVIFLATLIGGSIAVAMSSSKKLVQQSKLAVVK